MPLQPREILGKRKTKSSVYRDRNRTFGGFNEVQTTFNCSEIVLDYIFRARCKNTVGGCTNCGKPYHLFKKVPSRYAYKCDCKKSKLIFPLSGTPLEHCKKPLNLVIDIFYEMFVSKHGAPATEIDRRFSLSTKPDKNDEENPMLIRKNETSHFLLERISQMQGIAVLEQDFRADSDLEVDEVYPYVRTGLGPYYSFKSGLGSERLQPVITITERRSDGTVGLTKLLAVEETTNETLRKIFREHIKPTNRIFTDESKIYLFLDADEGEFKDNFHGKCNHKEKKWVVEGDYHVNGCEGVHSYVKKYIHYVHLGVSKEKIQFYLNRVAFNLSYRDKNVFEAIDALFSALPGLNESIENRVTCNRKSKKWLKAA